MEKEEVGRGKVLGNVGMLDLVHATPESIAGISGVGNVGIVLYSRQSASLLSRLNMGNVGRSIEVPIDATILRQLVITRDYFKHQAAPLKLVILGQLIVEPDVPAEDIETGLADLIVSRQLICPEHLAGVIQSKVRHTGGTIRTYRPGARLASDGLALDEHYLRSLDDASELVVIGHLRLSKVLSNELLAQKLRSIQVLGSITCHEENVEILLARLDDKAGSPGMTIIPAGFELVERPLNLDVDLLEALPARKLYCTERIQIDQGVDPSALDTHLEGLVAREVVICPVGLKGVLYRKCNMLETQVAFYEGELWLIEDERTLVPSLFEHLENRATLVVLGELTIAPDVDPSILRERLTKVHNLGMIRCTPGQMGVLQARLGLSEGRLVDSTPGEPSGGDQEKEEMAMGNVGYLKL